LILSDALDRRSRIGRDVHAFSDFLDKNGMIDETWLDEDTAGYVESWRKLKDKARIVVLQSSIRMCEELGGLALSGEMDKDITINGKPGIVDLKTASAKSDSWGSQLAAYEMLKYRSRRIGRNHRFVAHLDPKGDIGHLLEYGEYSPVDGMSYADSFLAALHCTYFALHRKYLTERDFYGN